MKTRALTLFLFSLALVTPVLAVDMQYWGYVTIGGTPAPDGTVVSVWVGSTQVATSTVPDVGDTGYYKVKISDLYTGQSADFKVDGGLATTVTLAAGSHYLNLTIIGPYCGDGICNNDENCGTCPSDCYTPLGYVCCDGVLHPGNCCTNADCSAGASCVSYSCTYGGGGGGGGTTGGTTSYCGDGTCNSNENCGTCASDCGCETGEICCSGACRDKTCESNADCDDANACTVDTCSGTGCDATCYHDSITMCQAGDNCCPGGCTIATDSDCGCVNECADGNTKCESDMLYACEQDNYGCWKWAESDSCTEGCCGDACCEQGGLIVAPLGGGLTGLAVIGQGIVSLIPFFILLMAIMTFASFHYYKRSKRK